MEVIKAVCDKLNLNYAHLMKEYESNTLIIIGDSARTNNMKKSISKHIKKNSLVEKIEGNDSIMKILNEYNLSEQFKNFVYIYAKKYINSTTEVQNIQNISDAYTIKNIPTTCLTCGNPITITNDITRDGIESKIICNKDQSHIFNYSDYRILHNSYLEQF